MRIGGLLLYKKKRQSQKNIVFFAKFYVMVLYDSEFDYIESKSDARSKITAIDAIISALLTSAAKAALSEDVQEYWLDDGQTKIKTVRRSVASITKSISELRKLKQTYMAQINGRIISLRGGKNFTGPNIY